MENRVFILVFLVVVLSFLFTVVSALLLHIRKKLAVSFSGILWLILFLIVIPAVNEHNLFELELFTDYTGGMRIEVHEDATGETLTDDIYIPYQMLSTAQSVCTLAAAGWLICMSAKFSFGLAGYFNNLHFLTKYSAEAHDERVNRIFESARKKAGIHRSVSLRIMKSHIRLSPCTCGIIFPAVYIGSAYTKDYSDERLELVFLHELIHIRHFDSLLKFLTLGITSVFFFLPISRRIRNAIGEDVEFRCDDTVLKIMGDNVCGEYISMILDVAERNLKDEYQGADFLSTVSRSGELIIRRYKNMKGRRTQKSGAMYAFPVLVAAVVLNMTVVSVVSVKDIDNLGIDFVNPLIERAVCEYLGITDAHELTENDAASIYSLEFALSDYRELLGDGVSEKYTLTCTLNEGLVWDGSRYAEPLKGNLRNKLTLDVVPEIIREDMFNTVMPADTSERAELREHYTKHGDLLSLDGAEQSLKINYIMSEYRVGNLDAFFTDSKTVDTRDIALFSQLRTLIFSDRLQSSEDEVYLSEKYAVISREK